MNRLAWILLVASACGSDADVAGDYTVAITNRDNGCSIGNWTVGAQTTATATVLQDGSNVTLQVNGIAGIGLNALLGTNAFTGKVDGDSLDLEATGTSAMTNNECMYTYNATLDSSQDGDSMTGRVRYRAATNGHVDCGTRTDCVSIQDFNATRPPS